MSNQLSLSKQSPLIKYPVAVIAAMFLVCVIFAKGDITLMTPVDMGVVMGFLGLVLFWALESKAWQMAVAFAASGLVFGLLSLALGNYITLTIGGGLLIVGIGVYLKIRGKLDHRLLIFLILAMGFWLQFSYAQYTPCWLRQNDVGFFGKEVFDPHHAGYISYIRYYGWIPHADVREMDQWYHPPLHHLICAYFLRLYGTVFPSLDENYDVLQMITLFYSFLSVVFIRKIVLMFDLSEKADTAVTAMVAFFPIFIVNAGELNNDILSVLFFVLSIYFIMRWYREGRGWANLVLSALTIGLGMMTKLSVWLAAVPVGIILLAVLVETRGKCLRLWGQYVVFALVSFPIGLWFPVRNYLGWGVPPSYIPVPIYTESLEKYSVFQRIFDVIGNEGYCNIPYFAVWSSLFDDDDYREHAFYGLLSFAVNYVFVIIVVIAVAGIVYWVVKTVKNKGNKWEMAALVMLVIAELTSYTIFCFKFPYICTMNFRYIIPITITFLIGLGAIYDKIRAYDKSKLPLTLVNICIVLFTVMTGVFYLSLWGYDLWYNSL